MEQIQVRCDVSKCSAEDKQEHTVSSGFVGKSLTKKVNSDQLTENTCHSDSISQQPARSYRDAYTSSPWPENSKDWTLVKSGKSHHGRMSGKKLELCRDRRLSGQRPVKSKVLCVRNIHRSEEQTDDTRGVSRIFERGGSNISWFPKKKSSGFKRGGSNGQMGGGPVH